MRRQTIVSLYAVNPAFGEGDPNWSTTAIKNVGMVDSITYWMEGDWEEASILIIPKAVDQVVIARGDIHGKTATIAGLGLRAYGSIKVRASIKQGHSVRIRSVLSVAGTDVNDHIYEYASARVN